MPKSTYITFRLKTKQQTKQFIIVIIIIIIIIVTTTEKEFYLRLNSAHMRIIVQ